MTSPEYDATWLKAVAFINRALDDTDEFEERAFWAACSLKLLATAAVIAGGQTGSGNVFRRCQSMTSRFDAVSANGIEASRGRYLDSGDAFCTSITPREWWASYWPLVDALMVLHGRQLADLVGTDREAEVKEIFCVATESVAARVRELMNRAADVYLRRRCGELTVEERCEIDARSRTHHSLVAQEDCPVCGGPGTLRGDTALAAAMDGEIAAEVFVCTICGLVLRGPDAIRAAGLSESFSTTRTLTGGD